MDSILLSCSAIVQRLRGERGDFDQVEGVQA